jgi:hypothetical protein
MAYHITFVCFYGYLNILRYGTFLSKCSQRFVDLIDVITPKKGINSKDIVGKICKGRQIINFLDSLWWDNISLQTKKLLEKSMIKSVACCGCKDRPLKRKE